MPDPVRHLRAQLTIIDKNGEAQAYSLRPDHSARESKAYLLAKVAAERTVYCCLQRPDGRLACTCPSGAHRPAGPNCKHLDALIALGCFDPTASSESQRQRDLLASLIEQAERP